MTSNVWFSLLDSTARAPVYSTMFSAGMDFFANQDTLIPPRGRSKIGTGISAMWQDPNIYLQIGSRSGLFYKKGIACVGGVIDYDYCQEIFILLQNHSDEPVEIVIGDRIAQGIFQPRSLNLQCFVQFPQEEFQLYLPFAGAEPRNGGLGSTGK